MTTAFAIVFWLGLAGIIGFLQWRHQCDCRRSRRPYFFTFHERSWVMGLWAAYMIPGTILAFVNVNYIFAVLNTLLLSYHSLRFWYHEKNKILKKAAKLAGRIGFNAHGKLVVTNN